TYSFDGLDYVFTNHYPKTQGIQIIEVRGVALTPFSSHPINSPDRELIIIADNLVQRGFPSGSNVPQDLYSDMGGATFPKDGMMVLVSRKYGVTNPNLFRTPAHYNLMHEMGHSLGLDH